MKWKKRCEKSWKKYETRRPQHVILIKFRRQHYLLRMFGGMCLVLMLWISCVWSAIFCSLSAIFCVLSAIFCLLSAIFCVLSVLFCLLTAISVLPYLLKFICVTKNHGYVLLLSSTFRTFLHSWHITGCVNLFFILIRPLTD
jgi:hypothetical protein